MAAVALGQVDDRQTALLATVAEMVPSMAVAAAALDSEQRFPDDEIAMLRAVGAFMAVLPKRLGGLGFGTEPGGAKGLFELLRLLGRGNLSVGRIYEGHVNALVLIATYGTETQLANAAREVEAGHFYAIWNTEAADGLRVTGSPEHRVLTGAKHYCSAAGHATRAVVTAKDEHGANRLLSVCLDRYARAERMDVVMQGMRASLVGRVTFDGMPLDAEALIGGSDDYLREPSFSAGAWRTSAITLGGLEALLAETRRQLVGRGRHNDPHQKTRMGEALIAQETARLWAWSAAHRAESAALGSAFETVAYVNLARIAIETATLDAIRLVQRSIGLSGFLHPNPIERLMRDLATYLRQPAPDDVLTEAAAWHMAQETIPESMASCAARHF